MPAGRRRFVAFLSLFLVTAAGACAAQAPAPPPADESVADAALHTAAPDRTPLLDGNRKSIVIVGYSTSYAWPTMLQEMLNEHAGGPGTYHVLPAVVGGSPLGRWIADPGSEDYEATYGAMKRDFFGPNARLRGTLPAPTMALLQQSLQRTPTREATVLGPVDRVDNKEGIEIGADALEKISMQLRDDGVERVVIAMHIYKDGFEPQIGNERFALDALLRRGHDFIFEGPDVWSLTVNQHPAAFSEDGLHPNELGAKIMAEAWYGSLAGDRARPEIIDAMKARSYDVNELTRSYIEWRRMLSNPE